MYIELITLLILILISSALFYLTRSGIRQIRFPHIFIFIAPILVFAGILLTCHAIDLVGSALEKKDWPLAEGIIVKSQVVGEKRAFHPQITYRFYLDNVPHENTTDLHMSGFGNKRARRDNANRVAREYPVNRQINVIYNPENPSESYLRTGPYWSDYMKLFVGCLFLCVGWYLLMAVFLKPTQK